MEDGEGRHIDFRNTIIILTSNVGTDLIAGLCSDPELLPEPAALSGALRQPLLSVFPAALLGRLLVVPYYPLTDATLGNIVRLQLGRIQRRLAENHEIVCTFDDAVIEQIVSRCTGRVRRPHGRRHPDQHPAAADQPHPADRQRQRPALSPAAYRAAEPRIHLSISGITPRPPRRRPFEHRESSLCREPG